MGRTPTGQVHLVPATVKLDPELKMMISHLAARERRSPSSVGNVLLQYGVMRWIEQGNLQLLIDELDKGWARTQHVRQTLRQGRRA